ncbi:MAG: group II intron reverse transcriptase/maturase [Sarcina sp.]
MEERLELEKKQTLRNNEYYCMQHILDGLYKKSKEGKIFKNLMELITSENNILLAYRNIKNNKGSMTKGTDNLDITKFKDLINSNFVKLIQRKFENYFPKSVRRVEIPKPNGKKRPLGIPCIEDRITQQCIKQILEPICEAKFHNNSYGFRPNRATTHAINKTQMYINFSKLHYVVDIDIKGFFDNVNHGKLIKQIWNIGVQDKNLICILSKILKSEIQGIGIPEKGTPQGGIISPLLSNIVLNELDWWLSSQWETFNTKHDYTVISKRKNGKLFKNETNRFRAMKQTNLKEIRFVRYADDFKIFCKDYETANKIYIATKLWLKERLQLEVSPEKSKITNTRKNHTEFLGFKIKTKLKRRKRVCKSRMSNKAVEKVIKNLKNQVKKIQRCPSTDEVNKLNSMILGIHNYYSIATDINLDIGYINFVISRTMEIRLKNLESNKPNYSKTYELLYGTYKSGKPRTIMGITIFPLYGCRTKNASGFEQEICNYTKAGRELIHKELNSGKLLIIRYLAIGNKYMNTELYDNSISLIAGQRGLCQITKQELELGNMECHHKKPKSLGGTDEYKNLVWLCYEAHKLVHSTEQDTLSKYLDLLKLDEKGLKRLNTLRKLVGNSVI